MNQKTKGEYLFKKNKIKKTRLILKILNPHGGLKQKVIVDRMNDQLWRVKPYLIFLKEKKLIDYDLKLKIYYITIEGQRYLESKTQDLNKTKN